MGCGELPRKAAVFAPAGLLTSVSELTGPGCECHRTVPGFFLHRAPSSSLLPKLCHLCPRQWAFHPDPSSLGEGFFSYTWEKSAREELRTMLSHGAYREGFMLSKKEAILMSEIILYSGAPWRQGSPSAIEVYKLH